MLLTAERFGGRTGSSSSSLTVRSITAECCRLPLDERAILDDTDCSREICLGVRIEFNIAEVSCPSKPLSVTASGISINSSSPLLSCV